MDTAIILYAKMVIIFGFVFSLNFWLRKTNSVFPVIIYWVLGIIFVLVVSSGIFEWLYTLLLFDADNFVFDKQGIGSMSSLTSIAFYIFLGVKFLKRKK